jgi:hypothetical protein
MKKAAIVFTAAALAITACSIPKPSEARGRWASGPAVTGGILAGAVVGGLASSAYGYRRPYLYYGPGYGGYGYGAYGSGAYGSGAYGSGAYGSGAYYGGYELEPGYYGYRRTYYGPRYYGW